MTEEPNFDTEATKLLDCIDQLSGNMRKQQITVVLQKLYRQGRIDQENSTQIFNLPSGKKMKIKEIANV